MLVRIKARQQQQRHRTELLQDYQLRRGIDHAITRRDLFDRKAGEAEAVTGEADRRRCLTGRSPIDDRITDEHRVPMLNASARGEVKQAGRIWLARKRSITADNRIGFEKPLEVETGEDASCGRQRLVGQNRERRMRLKCRQRLGNAIVGTCVVKQYAVVDREKAIERVTGTLEAARRKRARDQRRRAVADHLPDALLGQRLGAAATEQLVGRVGDVLLGIDQGAVEVEDDQTEQGIRD
jgi:hypothetical protein